MNIFRICITALLLCNMLIASELQQKVQKLMTKNSYQANEKFIKKIFIEKVVKSY